MKDTINKWWKADNKFFSEFMNNSDDRYTNGEVVLAQLGFFALLMLAGLVGA